MLRRHETPVALKAGALSLLVHAILLALLLVSFNWRVVQPSSIATVELWSELPSEPVKVVMPPRPEPRPQPKPEPKPEPKVEPKADIEVKKETPKPKEPQKKQEQAKPKEPEKKQSPEDDLLRKLQEEMLQDQPNLDSKLAQPGPTTLSAAQSGEVDKYVNMIRNKVHQHVNQQLCGAGNPELEFALSLAPTGDIVGSPRMLKGSGIAACDESVERAILLAQPLPVPKEPDLFARFRDLKMKFYPKGGN
ncbi:MAG TPA: cell envelope integrity protein TolA [Methylophilaceae bacterium]|jgi:colicin import membrane protein